MKKALIFAALLPLLFACNKDNSNKEIPTLPATPKADYAIKVEAPASSGLAPAFHTLEFTGDGNYILEKNNGGEVIIETGKYDVELKDDDVIYLFLDKDAKATLPKLTKANEINITFTLNGASFSGIVNLLNALGVDAFTLATCRDWVVDDIDVSVEGNGFSFGKVYNGACNLQTVATDLKAQGLNINPSDFAGYDVKSVEFTTYKSFKIQFAAAPVYYGSFDGFAADGSFNYTFDGNDVGNSFISASSKGQVAWNNAKPSLTLKSVIKDSKNNKEYNSVIKLTLKKAN